MILTHVREKIKTVFSPENKGILGTVVIIILSTTLAFGLGRLYQIESERVPVRIVSPAGEEVERSFAANVSSAVSEKAVSANALIVASKNSNKYHFSYCPGAKNISETNKITFASEEEARKAGYTLAANCKPK